MVDLLINLVKQCLGKVKDTRKENQTYSLSSMLRLAFAMFHLKDASLSSFRGQYEVRAENLSRVYGVLDLPGDTALREAIDTVVPSELQGIFADVVSFMQEHGVLKSYKVLKTVSKDGYTVVAIDGTQHYCSGKKSCPHCLTKVSRTGETTYFHQALGAVVVHPDKATVFPVGAEAIVKQDGNNKNDCELNALKRLLPQVSKTMATANIIAVLDGLYCNGPCVLAAREANMSYVISTKGQSFVDVQAERLRQNEQLQQACWTVANTNKTVNYTVNYANNLLLNGQHQDIQVNYFEVIVTDKRTGERLYYGTFITDIPINPDTVKELVQVARCRWKIENETFNTLKNQGYHLEHSYGHGKQYLATNFMLLTFLAFLVDQLAQYIDLDFQKAKQTCKTNKLLWELVRAVLYFIPTNSMSATYRFIAKREQIKMPALQ